MSNVLDAADRVFWWLRSHLAVGALVVAAIVAFAVFVLASGGKGVPKIPEDSVAVVGTSVIKDEDLTHWQEVYSQAATASGAEKPAADLARKAAFELLAGAQWVLEEAKAEEVEVTDKEVSDSIDAYFEQAGATAGEDRAKLQKQLGTNDEDMRFQQRVSLLAAKLQKAAADKAPRPSEAAVRKVYEAEPGRWATPSTRDLSAVVVADKAAADKAKAALVEGRSFEAVSKEFSANPQLTEEKGVIKGLENGQSGDAVDRAVFAAPVGEISGPVDTGVGFMVFRVDKSTPKPEQTLEQAQQAISQSLYAVAQGAAGRKYLAELRDRWKAKTRCTTAVRTASFCAGTPS